jgi:hypothetical protein
MERLAQIERSLQKLLRRKPAEFEKATMRQTALLMLRSGHLWHLPQVRSSSSTG